MIPHSFQRLLCLFAVAATLAHAQSTPTDPRITSWHTTNSGTYARVYETTTDKNSGNAVKTWPRSGLTNGGGGVSTQTYSDIQRVAYSANYVYVVTSGLPSYVMGNWLTPNGGVYTSWPKNRAAIHRIPRVPSIPTTKQKTNGSGGVLVNGVFVWANGDAQSYNTSTATVSMQGGQGIWNRLAGVAEAFNFDPAYGHQPNNGAYHNHVNPIALRYQLGDNVTYNASTKTYSEASTLTRHSPLIGWANDGLPIYGPYGYASAMDANSGIRRMTSGFQKRDGTNGSTNLTSTGRKTLPKWAAEVQGRSQTLASTEYGPNVGATYQVAPGVSGTYSLGMFAEDYEYLGDLGKTQGVDFDLNRQNVRYCVTPEFPDGTYAYFVCIDASGNTVFPDIINQEFFGTAAMGQGTVTSISETVTDYVRGGPSAAIAVTGAASGNGVALEWNSAEGATYKVESSADNATWSTVAAAVTSDGTTTSYTTAATANYFRVTLTAIATYDTNGTYGAPVGTTATLSYTSNTATAPTITTQPVSASVAAGASATFTVAANGTAPLTYQWRKDGVAISGATSATYFISSAQAANAGSYTCVVSNSAGSATSNAATLTITGATSGAPTISSQPSSTSAAVGGSVTFSVTPSGSGPFTYQWRRDGVAISGASAASYTIGNVEVSDAGSYTCVITNASGSVTSAAAVLVVGSSGGEDPRLTSWFTTPSTRYARLYETDAAKNAGTTVTTWSRGSGVQSSPSYAGVMQVSYSDDWVYLRSSGLGYHIMGPWYLNSGHTQLFPNFPANTNVLYRLPRSPAPAVTKTLTGSGAIGYFVDGVAMFDGRDTFSYVTASSTDATPVNGLRGDGIWNRDAYVNEAVTFDPAFAHQAGAQYHYHANTPALRYQLDDNVSYSATTKTYSEKTTAPTKHSPILGWVADGYPVYGPYGYASAMDPNSGVRRMISGYVKRDGTNGTTNLSATGRTTLPAWAATAQGRSATLAASQYGPNVSSTYVLGHYLEDYDYLGDLGGTQGTTFDLDLYNGRFCVTPEFPNGTYAYFMSIESDGTPKFPYNIGRWFYGSPTGGSVSSISETVSEYVRSGPTSEIAISAAAAGSGVALSWNSVEGATYKVESSSDGTSWTTLSSAVTSQGVTTSYTAAAAAASFRVTLTAIATYTTNATVGAPVGTTATYAYATVPTVSTPPANAAVTAGGTATLSVAASGTGPFTYQWTRNGANVSGATGATLTLSDVQPGTTGVYQAAIANSAGTVTTEAAIVGVDTASKTVGDAREVGTDILHPVTQNIYDQILLEGAAATFTANPGQVTRMSFIDLANNIVQVEFSGAGTVSVVLDNPSGPATPEFYNQETVTYMKGHPSIVVTGANETTNLSVFSVGRANAVNQALFRDDVAYDGWAGIAFIAIASTDGKFGGLRTANGNYFATKGITGVYAPGVEFTGPVFVGEISASDTAIPHLLIGSGSDVRITGGDLTQPNGEAVRVKGITQLQFTAGATSHGAISAAQTNKARLEQDGVDVTAQIVVGP